MARIGGNTEAMVQKKTGYTVNAIGSRIPVWEDYDALTGYLDLMGEYGNNAGMNAQIREATHIFMCDCKDLTGVNAQNARFVIDGESYYVMLVDDPMRLHQHLEIYLKYVEGQEANGN